MDAPTLTPLAQHIGVAITDVTAADLLSDSAAATCRQAHHWQVGDLVIWDNTGMLHRAQRFEPTSARFMHRTTLVGEEAVA